MSQPIAVIYYSRSGHTLQAAQTLAKRLGADLVEITTRRYGNNVFGFLRAGFESMREISPPISVTPPDMTHYTAAVICGPVWTSFPATPLRAFMKKLEHRPQTLGLLLTNGDKDPPERAFALAESDLGTGFAVKTAIPNSLEGTAKADEILSRLADDVLSVMKTGHLRVVGASVA